MSLPSSPIRALPILGLAGLLFTGAFSRFTHGRYTPSLYAFQEAHAPDDGGALARVTPCIDTALGVLLFWPRTRRYAAAFATVFCVIGLVQQVGTGKAAAGDCAMVGLGAGATLVAFGW